MLKNGGRRKIQKKMTKFVMTNKVNIMKTQLETQRKKLGFKVYELANKLSIDQSLMSRILSGKREPTETQLKQLANVLAIDYNELLKEKIKQQIQTAIRQYPEISEEIISLVNEERAVYLAGENALEVIDSTPFTGVLNKLSALQEEWSTKKPLDPLQLEKMREYFHTEYTYDSNQIEGNTLDFQETHLVVNEGITIGGKTMKEHLEAINHQDAIEFIVDLVSRKIDFSENILKQIHQLILKEIDKARAGVYRTVQVRISGSKHLPPEPYLLDSLMYDYFRFYQKQKNRLHPVILAAEMHERLVTIHPFIDGNGRTSRLIMNLILLRNGYPIVSLKGDLPSRQRYYKALEAVQVNHESSDFYQLIIERTKISLEEHIKMC